MAHDRHMGIDSTKRMLRQQIFFLDHDIMVKGTTGSCLAWQASMGEYQLDPLKPNTIPSKLGTHSKEGPHTGTSQKCYSSQPWSHEVDDSELFHRHRFLLPILAVCGLISSSPIEAPHTSIMTFD